MNLDTSNIENLINKGKFKESLAQINILELKKNQSLEKFVILFPHLFIQFN